MNPVIFATVANDQYIDGLMTMLYSMVITKNLKQEDKIVIHYNSELSPLSIENQHKIKKIWNHIKFVNFKTPLNEKLLASNSKIAAAYLFLSLFQIKLDGAADRIICFDSDMLCLDNYDELRELNHSGISICTDYTRDWGRIPYDRVRNLTNASMFDAKNCKPNLLERLINISIKYEQTLSKFVNSNQAEKRKQYFNSGFFIIHEALLNKNNGYLLYEHAKKYFANSPNDIGFADQPIITRYIEHEKIPLFILSNIYNGRLNLIKSYQNTPHSRHLDKIKIVHFTGIGKPWKPEAQKKYEMDYFYNQWMKTYNSCKSYSIRNLLEP